MNMTKIEKNGMSVCHSEIFLFARYTLPASKRSVRLECSA